MTLSSAVWQLCVAVLVNVFPLESNEKFNFKFLCLHLSHTLCIYDICLTVVPSFVL